jgi:hypothetical protein
VARDFGTNHVVVTALTGHATQRTYSIWAQHDSSGEVSGRLFCKEATATNLELFAIEAIPAFFYRRNWSSTHGHWRWDYPSTGVWHHHCIRYNAGSTANDPSYWRDGASIDGSRVKASAPSGTISTSAEAYHIGNRGPLDRDFDGRLAEFAVWDVLLADGEVRALSRGVSPLRIRPQSLAGYWPLYGASSPEPDFTGNGTATVSGATVSPHPPVQAAFGFDEMWLPRPLPVVDTCDQPSLTLDGLVPSDVFLDSTDQALLALMGMDPVDLLADGVSLSEFVLAGIDATDVISRIAGKDEWVFRDVRESPWSAPYRPTRNPLPAKTRYFRSRR